MTSSLKISFSILSAKWLLKVKQIGPNAIREFVKAKSKCWSILLSSVATSELSLTLMGVGNGKLISVSDKMIIEQIHAHRLSERLPIKNCLLTDNNLLVKHADSALLRLITASHSTSTNPSLKIVPLIKRTQTSSKEKCNDAQFAANNQLWNCRFFTLQLPIYFRITKHLSLCRYPLSLATNTWTFLEETDMEVQITQSAAGS